VAVKTYDPKISVVLRKNIGRGNVAGGVAASQRYTASPRTIDLTPFLGDRSSVVTSKSVREPAGMFSVTLPDRMADGDPVRQFETLYGLIEPMDVIEIRMARDTSKYAGYDKNMPMVMRGLVSEVRRQQSMGADGPDRSVVITGQDYGKILQIMQIAYLPNEVTGQNLLTYLSFFVNYGVDAIPNQPAAHFFDQVNTKVITKFLDGMRAASGAAPGQSPIVNITLDATVGDGVVCPIGTINTYEGTLGGLLAHYGDVGPWNEMFVEDRETGPFLVYRPTPFKDPSGTVIQAGTGAVAPAVVSITSDDVVSITQSRSDSDVANYYWVEPAHLNMIPPGMLAVEAAHDQSKDRLYLTDYPNSSPNLYGFRRLQVQSNQGFRVDGQKESVFQTQGGLLIDFVTRRRDVLVQNNRDNVVFESGTMQLKGNESVRAGMTVKLTPQQGGNGDEHYAVQVQHEFLPFRSFMTTVSFERGTGFIRRITAGSDNAPYLAEMNVGGVYAQ